MIGSLLLHTVLILLAVTGICCFTARFAAPLRQVFASFFALIHTPFQRILDGCEWVFQGIRRWISTELQNERVRDEASPTYFFIGAVLYSFLTVLFLCCDYGMIVLTLEAMGLETSQLKLPLDASSLTALTLLSTSLFWGMILFDLLGVTHVAPWREVLSKAHQQIMIGLCMAMIGTALLIVVILGYWRGESMSFVPEVSASVPAVQEDIGFQSFGEDSGAKDQGGMAAGSMDGSLKLLKKQEWVTKVTMMSIAALSCLSTAPAVVGLIKLFKFLMVIVVFSFNILLLPVAGLAWLVTVLSNALFAFIQSFLDLCVAVGASVLRLFGYETQAGSSNQSRQIESNEPPSGQSTEEEPVQTRDPGFNPFHWRQS